MRLASVVLPFVLWSCTLFGDADSPKMAAASAPTSTPAPEKKTGLVGAPYTLNKKVQFGHEYESGFIFLGWSESGRYYAFEVERPSMGGADCDYGSIELEVIDASTDRWAKGTRLVVANEDPMDCKYKNASAIRAAFDAQKVAKLNKYKIKMGHLLHPIKFEPTGGDYVFPLVNGGLAEISFSADTSTQQYDKLGYRLAWKQPFSRQIERGKKRDCMSGYRLNSVFRSPSGTHVAFVVEKFMCGYEGEERGFMTNGSAIVPKKATANRRSTKKASRPMKRAVKRARKGRKRKAR